MGKGRRGVLGVESPDPVLSLLAALGLAQAAGTALVVDLGRDLAIEGGRTLADMAAEGPSLPELSPGRSGVALIPAGPLGGAEVAAMIESLLRGWPAIVVRVGREEWPGPTVPVRALLPGLLRPVRSGPSVWQSVGSAARPPGPGPVLPRLRPGLVRALLGGRLVGRSRWVRSWASVWEMPWG